MRHEDEPTTDITSDETETANSADQAFIRPGVNGPFPAFKALGNRATQRNIAATEEAIRQQQQQHVDFDFNLGAGI